MKVFIEGSSTSVTIKDTDFIHQGGEGSVFISGNTAYKIYHDPKKMIEVDRIKELRKIKNSSVITPELIIYNESGNPIGYTMRAINDTWALTRLFSKSFRKRQNVSESMIVGLVSKMREVYSDLHSGGFLVADGNEQNFLVSSDFSNIYFIDTDSFKTPSFSARAYNESTLDPLVDVKKPVFTQSSDWFAFAVVSFQLITGVHPFKGTVIDIQKEQNTIPQRIKMGLSIFNKRVNKPRMIVDEKQIDNIFGSWLKDVFETNKRNSPPEIYYISKETYQRAMKSGNINIELIPCSSNKITDILNFGSTFLIRTEEGLLVDGLEFKLSNPETKVVFDQSSGDIYFASIHNGGVVAKIASSESLSNIIYCNPKFLHSSGKLLYAITSKEVLEISTRIKNSSIRIFGEALDNINIKSLKVFDGVLIESLLGGLFANILTGEPGVYTKLNISENKDNGVLNAKYRNGLLYIVTSKSGEYCHKLFKVSGSFKEILLVDKWISSSLEISMDVLDSGVYALIKNDELLIAGHKSLKTSSTKEISLIGNQSTMDIISNGSKFVAIIDGNAYKISMS